MRHERPGRRMLCLEEEEAAEPNQPGKEPCLGRGLRAGYH